MRYRAGFVHDVNGEAAMYNGLVHASTQYIALRKISTAVHCSSMLGVLCDLVVPCQLDHAL